MRYARRKPFRGRRRVRGRRVGRRSFKRRTSIRKRRSTSSSDFVTIVKRIVIDNQDILGGVNVVQEFSTVIGDVPDVNSYLALYQQYRIRKISFMQKPNQNFAQIGGTIAKPVFESIVMKSTYYPSIASLSEVQNSSGYKRGYSLYRSWRPLVDIFTLNSLPPPNQAAANMMKYSPWLDCRTAQGTPANQPVHHGLAYQSSLPPLFPGPHLYVIQQQVYVVDFRYKR